MKAPHRRAHGAAALLMAIAIPAILVVAFVARQDRDGAPEPVRLEAPR